MNTRPKPRVLVVDNDVRVGEHLRSMLEPQNYSVQIAEGLGQALPERAVALARSFRPHVAIVDLRLLDEYRDERSGLGLLQRLQPARCILYSAYLKPEVTREALKEYDAFDCIGKSEEPERLMYAIAEAALESCAGRRDLSIRLPSAWTRKKIVQTSFGDETDVPYDIVEDVIGQLFPENREVMLETMEGEVASSISAYQRRSIVLKVYPDDLEPKVIKLAPVKRIRSEARNYSEYVRDRLIGSFYAQLERSVEYWDLGGSVYTFLGSSLKDLPRFSSFYRQEMDPEAILRPLRHFFKDVWCRHYEEPKRPENLSLFQIYDRSFRLRERLEGFSNQEEIRAFPGLPGAHTNPVPWVLRHSDSSFIPEARTAITHGDVHGDNLFVDGEHAWAIDFERTGPGHVLRDFVELEVDIFTRLAIANSQDLSESYELAVALAAPIDPSTACQPTASLSSQAEVLKALNVIGGLRRMAKEVTRCRDSREYFWGLLLDTLFVAALAPEHSHQREPALLLGSVLCDRLRNWGSRWPQKTRSFPINQEQPNQRSKQPTTADAFLSYNSSDRNTVLALARYLKEEAKLNVWLDQWNLLPGDAWREKIDLVLDKSRTCVIFWGGSGLGPWQHEEMRAALERRARERDYRIVPVLLPGCLGPEKMPAFLQGMTYVDFRNGLNDWNALQYLIEGIRAIAPDLAAGD